MIDIAHIITDNIGQITRGLWVTIQLCLIIWSIGILGGILFGIFSYKWPRLLGWPINLTSVAVAATPAIVLMFWFHYPVQSHLNIVVDPFITAAFTLSLINALLVGEVVRDHLMEFPKQYIWSAMVSGIPRRSIVLKIMLPMLSRMILPKMLAIQISMLQATIFASLISVDEIFRICLRINSVIHKPVEIFTALALFFVLICFPLHLICSWLRMKFIVLGEER